MGNINRPVYPCESIGRHWAGSDECSNYKVNSTNGIDIPEGHCNKTDPELKVCNRTVRT